MGDLNEDIRKTEAESRFEPEIIRYEEAIFIEITEANYREVIRGLCKAIYCADMSNSKIMETGIAYEYTAELNKLLQRLPRPYTIIQEPHYIDRSFRDTYYTYFSNQHFEIKRFSRRLSFVGGKITREQYFSDDPQMHNEIVSRFMGACVVNPLPGGIIGTTLIAPEFLLEKDKRPIYVRLSNYTLHVYGKKFFVNAFPYRMQDEETMRCAEVTLLNLLDYYSNSYRDYRSVVPSEILESEQKHNHERVLPSRGISFPILTKVLSEFGFSPRLYNLSAIDKYCLSKVTQEDELKRWMHYYIESGIPVALNLFPAGKNDSAHSIVCIGHGCMKEELIRKAKRNKWISWRHKDDCHPIINSADFYDEYVVVDDNKPVYQVRDFQHLSLYPDMRVENIAVPLYKRMFLDASDAAAIVRALLHDEKFGIDIWAEGFLNPREDVIIRLFMASSHSLKDFRTKTLSDIYSREAYALVPMPRFVWVCEIYREEDYALLNAFGELVIDATSVAGRGNSTKSLIMVHYPGVLGVRDPEIAGAELEDMVELSNTDLFPGYRNNLHKIE